MKTQNAKKLGGLLAATLVFNLASANGGETVAPKPAKDVIEKAPESNPLSFFDGRLIFDVQERLRMEVRDNTVDFNKSVNALTDDTWLLNRFRLGVAVKPVNWVKIYGQTQDSREFESKRPHIPNVMGADGDNTFDLRQAYVELSNYKVFPVGITIGRQGLTYGDSRLVADSQWTNYGRTFDAVKIRVEQPGWWVDGFFARPVQIKRGTFDDSDSADNFAGVYFSTQKIPNQTTDLFFFYRDKGDNQPDLQPVNPFSDVGAGNGPAARFATIGTRIKSTPGKLAGFDYEGEFAYEFGDVWVTDRSSAKSELSAFAAHVAGGYTFENYLLKPRFGLEYNFATGDKNPGDNKSQSFQTLFPSNHAKYGLMDEFAWRNIHNARAQFNFVLLPKVTLELDYQAFWLADTSDFWYRGSSALRARTPAGQDVRRINASNFAGHEVDMILNYDVTKFLKLQAGYSHFFAGTYLKNTGAHDDADFGYLQALLQF